MTIVTMPDGQPVDFGDMPPDQIRALIQKKFPDAVAGVPPPKMGVVEDVARSVATGAGEALHGAAGMVGDLFGFGMQAGRFIDENILGNDVKSAEEIAGANPLQAVTSQAMEGYTGFDQHKHTPQTTAGEFARTAAQFATPVAPFGLRAATKFGVVPGVISEAAGQATEGSDYEGAARVLAGLGSAGVMAFMSRPTTAAGVLKRAMPKGVTNNDIMKADSLMAQSRASGVPITWPEALHKVTEGRVDVTGLQRIVEQAPGGQPIMSDFMSPRPAQTKQAMGGAMDDLTYGFGQTDPRMAGQTIQRASDEGLTAIRQRINRVTEPLYRQSAGTRLDPAAFASLKNDPLYQDALKAVRSDPVYSRKIQNLADDTVGVQNEVKKYLDDLAGSASASGKNQAAATYGGVRDDVKNAATTASRDYERALGLQTDMRRQFLNPAESGPLGAFAKTDDILAQSRALFTPMAAEGSERAVTETVKLLSRRAPDEAFQLVRTHLTSQFDEASQSLISGPNQWGGAKFAAAIRGNSQQAKNLEAAVRALPDGDIRWEGLNAFLDVLEATGRRQRPGSMTAFNQQTMEELKRGGAVVESARMARTLMSRVFDFYDQWKLGKNSADLARLITDPKAAKMLRDLANAKNTGARTALAGKLLAYATLTSGQQILDLGNVLDRGTPAKYIPAQ